jgi:hypothetical protein
MRPLFFVLILLGCSSKNDNGQDSQNSNSSGNQALYDEVMKVHDEVMPKMNDIYKLKEDLKKEIANAPDIVEEKRKEIESAILQLDAASESMMDWMRNFDPLPDSSGEEKARQYLEEQKVKVDKVKETMLQAIENAKELNQ